MSEIIVKEAQPNRAERITVRRGRQLRTAAVAGGLAATAVIAPVIVDKASTAYENHQNISYIKEKLQNTGEIEEGSTYTFSPGTVLCKSPAVIDGKPEEGYELVRDNEDRVLTSAIDIKSPIIVTGNDGLHYIAAIVPNGEHASKPTDISTFAQEAVLIPLEISAFSHTVAPGVESVPEMRPLDGTTIPVEASEVVFLESDK